MCLVDQEHHGHPHQRIWWRCRKCTWKKTKYKIEFHGSHVLCFCNLCGARVAIWETSVRFIISKNQVQSTDFHKLGFRRSKMTVPEGICSQSRRWGTRGRLSLSPTAASGSLSPLSKGTPMDSDDGGFTPAPRVQLVCSFQISRLDGGSFFQATHQSTLLPSNVCIVSRCSMEEKCAASKESENAAPKMPAK